MPKGLKPANNNPPLIPSTHMEKMRAMSTRLMSLFSACLAAALLAAAAAACPARGGETAPPLEDELRARAIAAAKAGTLGAFRAEVAGRLGKALAEPEALGRGAGDLEILEHYLNVGRLLDFPADDEGRAFLAWFLEQREFCSRFLHALEPTDSPAKAVEVLRRLKAVKGVDEKRYLRHSEMLIALARIWDAYEWLPWTGLEVPADRLEDIYVYYLNGGAFLRWSPEQLPHELLLYLVDHPLPKDERDFVLRNYLDNQNPARVFFEIRWTEDAGALGGGRNKSLRYSLMNIKERGGICMEQAYYATSVAKCLGIPAAYCRGIGGRGAHAWVGVLRKHDGAIFWDFRMARYGYDHYWRGETFSPACRRAIVTDGEVAMSAGYAILPRSAVESADARRGLALFLLLGDAPGAAAAGDPPEAALPDLSGLAPGRRKLLHDLLYSSVQANPCALRSWQLVGAAAARGAFSQQEIQAFSDLLFRSVDRYSPDFACRTVQLFLAAVKDEADRDRLYEACFAYFKKRPDLAAELKVAQGRRREADGKPDLALRSYLDAVSGFPWDGHVTQEAAKCLDELLAKGEPRKAVEVLTGAWRSMDLGVQGGGAQERIALRLVGENLIKYLKLAGMEKELAAFEPAFRRAFPAQRR